MALWNRILFPISNLWDNGDSSTPPNPTVSTAGGGTLNTEPIAGDSLTQYSRSLTNLLGTTAADIGSSGKSTYASGTALFDGPTRYNEDILNGDRNAALAQEAPDVRSILSQYDGARQALSEFAPRGGGRASGGSNLAFKQAGDINALLQRARPQASANLTNIGQILSSLGLSQEQLGLTGENYAAQDLLGRRGQNIQENANTQQILAGLGASIGKLLVPPAAAAAATGG